MLALDTAPVTWPIGRGTQLRRHLRPAPRTSCAASTHDEASRIQVNGPRRSDASPGCCPSTSATPGIEEVDAGAARRCRPFDLEAFREGHLTPVFFGCALRNFGVRDLHRRAWRPIAPPPRGQEADERLVEADEPAMTGFVFKIQANMDPNHRDRIAFVRVCSGKLARGMKAKLRAHGQADEPERAAILLRAATARSPTRPGPATWSASPTTARCASATR